MRLEQLICVGTLLAATLCADLVLDALYAHLWGWAVLLGIGAVWGVAVGTSGLQRSRSAS
jgi:hypothetical protein